MYLTITLVTIYCICVRHFVQILTFSPLPDPLWVGILPSDHKVITIAGKLRSSNLNQVANPKPHGLLHCLGLSKKMRGYWKLVGITKPFHMSCGSYRTLLFSPCCMCAKWPQPVCSWCNIQASEVFFRVMKLHSLTCGNKFSMATACDF